jgi:glycosyltransferase involved in cell wall biosynthesis
MKWLAGLDREKSTMTERLDPVLIVANYEPDHQKSMLRFGDALAENLQRLGADIVVVRPPAIFNCLACGNRRLKKLMGYLDKYAIFPIMLAIKSRSFRVVHIIDHSNALYIRFCGAKRTVVTCHDLFPLQILLGEIPGLKWGLNGRILQRMNFRGLRAARRFTSVSAKTAAELVRLVDNGAPIMVIPNALSDIFAPGAAAHGTNQPAQSGMVPNAAYFLHVGSNAFYKNRLGVVRLFAELARREPFKGHRLVLAGQAPDDELAQELAQCRVRERIDVRVDPDDAGIRALYAGAEALLFISLNEGFGWPIIEAQAMGCAVVTSDREPMRGVAGGAAVLVDPEDPAGAATAIAAASAEFADLRQRGLANAQNFAPEIIYPRYLDIYRQVANG